MKSVALWPRFALAPEQTGAAAIPLPKPAKEEFTFALKLQPAGVGFASIGAETGSGAFGTITHATK